MKISTNGRARWAAVGAAVAVAAGAGGFASASIGEGDRTVFVPIEPCRLLDTRPDSTVGPRNTPLGPGEAYDVTAVGSVGNCTLPDDAVGLVVNATALQATQPTYLTFYGTGLERPTASHLNPLPGDGPAPNAVTTDLGEGGAFSIYNAFGTVHVLADVVGYYADHHHDDRYYTQAEADARFAAKGDIGDPYTGDHYTKDESDALYSTKTETAEQHYTKDESHKQFVSAAEYVPFSFAFTEPGEQVLATAGDLSLVVTCEYGDIDGENDGDDARVRFIFRSTGDNWITPLYNALLKSSDSVVFAGNGHHDEPKLFVDELGGGAARDAAGNYIGVDDRHAVVALKHPDGLCVGNGVAFASTAD